MLGVDGHQPAHGAGDAVYAEWLRRSVRTRSREDDRAVGDVGVMDAGNRVLQL